MTGCLLPALFAAHQGLADPIPLYVPVGLDVHPPPAADKVVLGDPLVYRLDTENFSIQWSDPSVLEETATIAAEALESAWDVLVVDEAWGPPPTGDWAKILVYLDPSLSGTGLTNGLVTEANPDGAPLIYLNPIYIDQPDFFRSVAVHEFGHALQFRVRTWYGADETEPWYWEATSEWMTEVVNPDWDQYAWSAAWYAAASDDHFDSMDAFHQYGMMLLNAYLDEYRGGSDTIWSIWLENEGQAWLDEIERVLGEPAIETWTDFVGAYGSEGLVDSSLYESPSIAPQVGEIEGRLGSAYVSLGPVNGGVELTGGVGTMVRDGAWFVFEGSATIPDGVGPVTVVVTNPMESPLQYSVSHRSEESSDEPDSPDSTTPDGSEAPPADFGVGDESTEKARGCACTTHSSQGPGSLSVVFVWLLCALRCRFWSQEESRPPSRHRV